ncbi:Fimbrial protein precursor [compost metagenome]
MKRLGKEEKGFTLIELLAVIVILGIIAIIAIPLISNIISKSKSDSDLATARQVYDAARLYVINEKNGDFTDSTLTSGIKIVDSTSTDTLQGKGYLEKGIFLPSTKKKITGGTVKFDASGEPAATDAVTISTGSGTGDTVTFSGTEILSAKKAATTTTTTTTTP